MKNHFDYLKGKFGAWTKLKNKTGNVYDPVSNIFNLSEEECEIEKKSNKFVEPVRSTGLLFPELCVQLFDGSTSNGFDSWGSSSNLPNDCEYPCGRVEVEDLDTTQELPTPTQEPMNSTQEGISCP